MDQTLKKIITAGVVILLLGMGFVAGWTPSVQADSLTGLRIMKQMAQDAVPYDAAIANPKPTLIEFYADWCPVCQSMAPTLQTLEQQYGTDINFVMLNVDDPQWLPQIDQYQVTGVPHFIALDPQPQLVKSLIGKLPPTILSTLLEQLVEAPTHSS